MYRYLIILFLISCNRKTTIVYQDKVVTTHDTVTVVSKQTDTIPCDDFDFFAEDEKKDTVFVSVVDKQLSVKYIKKTDTIYKETIIVQPTKQVTKIDNSVKAKKGSIIGNDNTMTTKKNNWWWIFLCGMLVMFLIQNVGFRILKNYFPFLRIM